MFLRFINYLNLASPQALNKSEGHRQENMNTTKELVKKSKENSGNGKQKAAVKKVDRKEEKKPLLKIEAAVIEKKPEPTPEVKVLSIDEKLQKLDDLNDLVEKRYRLKESSNKLNSFDLKRESHSTGITLTDGSGNRFQTTNTKAVETFIEMTKQAIQLELDKVEEKIQF